MIILILILVIVLAAVGIYFYRKQTQHSSTGSNTGPTSCGILGNQCSSSKDCCSEFVCKNNRCLTTSTLPQMNEFLWTNGTTGIGLVADGKLGLDASLNTSWGTLGIPKSFWYWDGQGQLTLKAPNIDANGNVTSISNYSILPPTTTGYPTLSTTPVTGIVLTTNNAVYSSDYTLCIGMDETGHLVWQNCLGVPSTFDFIQPSNCSSAGQCSQSSQCCPPYGSCVNGQCSTCFGDPAVYQAKNCPNSSFEIICTDSSYACQSRCTNTVTCPTGTTGSCQIAKDGTYRNTCISLCTEPQTPCTYGTSIPICSEISPNNWNWTCPTDPCNLPPPPISDAPAYGNGYTWNNDHWESPNQPWQYPQWDCNAQKWKFTPGCNQAEYTSCKDSQKAICSPDTSFQWQCVDSGSNLDLCGLSPKPSNPDAVCLDISSCQTSNPTSNNWRWIVPSTADECETIKIYNYQPINVQNIHTQQLTQVYFDQGSQNPTPIYPSVLNNTCRSIGASDHAHSRAIQLLNNPTGTIIGDGQTQQYQLLDDKTMDGSGKYVLTKFPVNDPNVEGWYCASPNPCLNNGTFVNLDGSAYSPVTIAPNGFVTPPSVGELLNIGKCDCQQGFAGPTCAYSKATCSNNGTPINCNSNTGRCVNSEYLCNCDIDHYGLHCQYDRNNCSNHGTPNTGLDTLQCVCDYCWSGTDCSGTFCPTMDNKFTVGAVYKLMNKTWTVLFAAKCMAVNPDFQPQGKYGTIILKPYGDGTYNMISPDNSGDNHIVIVQEGNTYVPKIVEDAMAATSADYARFTYSSTAGVFVVSTGNYRTSSWQPLPQTMYLTLGNEVYPGYDFERPLIFAPINGWQQDPFSNWTLVE